MYPSLAYLSRPVAAGRYLGLYSLSLLLYPACTKGFVVFLLTARLSKRGGGGQCYETVKIKLDCE
jgi:hypothetical protein